MERIQSVSGHREDAGPACVVCDAALDGARCGHCGAAVAPGGYLVQRVISQSVHGRVYLAVDREGRRVALKELLFALVPGVEQLDAFEREAAVLRSLSHPDIPRFVASFQEGSGVGTRLYLAQEYLEGESLLQRIEPQSSSGAAPRQGGGPGPGWRVSAAEASVLRRPGLRFIGSPSAALTSRSAPSLYPQQGPHSSYT